MPEKGRIKNKNNNNCDDSLTSLRRTYGQIRKVQTVLFEGAGKSEIRFSNVQEDRMYCPTRAFIRANVVLSVKANLNFFGLFSIFFHPADPRGIT